MSNQKSLPQGNLTCNPGVSRCVAALQGKGPTGLPHSPSPSTVPFMSEHPPSLVGRLRSTYASGRTRPLSWRLAQLRALGRLLDEQSDALEAALHADLGKPAVESFVTELSFLQAEVKHTSRRLRGWLRAKRAPVPAVLQPGRARVVLEPLGVALIIAPWNYPLMLSLSPLIGAMAAGNAAVLKPSELAPATSAALAELLPRYLDSSAIAVVEGGVPETTALLEERFDTIFYTGNGRVGRIVAAAAAKHLTPVTLELGGKSPAYVDDSVDLRAVAERLVWAKFINAGQTCVAPDYILTSPATSARLVPLLREAVARQYGSDPARSADYGRIVDDRAFDRLVGLLDGETPAIGGDFDRATRYISPTVLTGVTAESSVMQGEIFGPLLPVLEVPDAEAAMRFVAAGDKPLAAYVFSDRRPVRRRWLTEVSSGGVVFNAAVVHLSVPGLPFGGVGESGSGSYHGRRSLLAFSHEKAVLSKPLKPDTLALLRAPYTAKRASLIRRLLS
jgi:aldehyde dehydrogenase (NAD+)